MEGYSGHVWYTLGPATVGRECELLKAGATGARLTFSYGTPELQLARAEQLRTAARFQNSPFLNVADLSGGKIRLGEMGDRRIRVKGGDLVQFVRIADSRIALQGAVPVDAEEFFSSVRPKDRLVVGDGNAELEVRRVAADAVSAEAVGPGVIEQRRGLTIRGEKFAPACLSEKDRDDLRHVASHGEYDLVALSFVGSSDDIQDARTLMREFGRELPVVAKIETMQGIENIEAICETADFVMAARGDLALSMPWTELPGAVRRIADVAAAKGTSWIIGTQVMEGLELYSMPTRAEICDLAAWASAGCSGVLLSHETAFGSQPIMAVECARELLQRWSTGIVVR